MRRVTDLIDCERRLAADPYDLAALAGALLESAARRTFSRAAAHRATMARLHLLAGEGRALDAIARGGLPVLRSGNTFYTRIPLGDHTEAVTPCFDEALRDLGAITGRAPPLIWVDFSDLPAHASATRRETPGFCKIVLSNELLAGPYWRATIWHECAHALVSAHCRFLDEGWAVWCQYRSGAPSLFPATLQDAERLDLERSIAEAPLEGLLRFDGADAAFRDLAENDDEQVAIYLRAFRLVGAVIENAGGTQVADMFDRVARGDDAAAILRNLAPDAMAADEARVSLAGIDRAFRWLRSCSAEAGAVFLPRVRAMLERAPDCAEAWELRGRMAASLMLNRAPHERADLLQELDVVIGRLETLKPSNAIAEMLRGLQAVAQVGLAPEALLVSVLARAEAHLVRARDLKGDDGDVNIALARMEMKKPFFWTADRASALIYLADAAADPRCRWEAVSLSGQLSAPAEARALR